MTEVKTIKDVDENTWSSFKSMAARDRQKLGLFFKTIVHNYEETQTDFWKDLLASPKILSDTDAADMQKAVRKLRKEYGFRK